MRVPWRSAVTFGLFSHPYAVVSLRPRGKAPNPPLVIRLRSSSDQTPPSPESSLMENKSKSLHVNPVGENWEVESDAITLGQTETQSEAIELAKELASAAEVANIVVHTSDGFVETELSVDQSTKNSSIEP